MDNEPSTTADTTKADPTQGHTPTPWRAHAWTCHAALTVGSDKDGRFQGIADCSGFGEHSDVGVANAALIVRAVNAHAHLVAALKKLRTDMLYTAPEAMAFKAQEKWMPLIDDVIRIAEGGVA